MNFLLRSLLLLGLGASGTLLVGCYPSYPSGYGYGGYSRPYYSRPYYGGGGGYYYSRRNHDYHDHHDHHDNRKRYYGTPANHGGNKPQKVSSSHSNRKVNPSTGGYANPRMQAAYQARNANRNRSGGGGGGGNNKKKKN